MNSFAKDIAPLFDSIMVEDLTHLEKRIVKMLVSNGLLKIVDEDGVPTVETI